MNSYVRLGLVILVCALSPHIQAEDGYWVVLGSTSELTSAENITSNAAVLGQSVSTHDVETARGRMHRVVAGPFEDKFQAQEVASGARSKGFPDAWLVRMDPSTSIAIVPPATPAAVETATYAPDASLPAPVQDLSIQDVPIQDAPGQDVLAPSPADEEQQESTRELLDQTPDEIPDSAPPGYNLNKLRRDAQARPPPGGGTVPGSMQIDLNIGDPILLTRLPHSESRIKIDGKIDEPLWQTLPVVDDFHTSEPDTGVEPELATRLRVFYTEQGIYASWDMDQPRDRLVQWISSRDQVQLNRDHIGLMLDTSGEGLYGYWFMVALGGSTADGTVLPERRVTPNWDGAWYSASAVTEKGWSVELYLPWSQVAMPKHEGKRSIGLYTSRKYSAKDERWTVPTLPPTTSRFLSAFRPMMLEDVDPRQQWSVFPFAAATQNEVEDGLGWKAGADVFWRPSTNFQLTATLNPDFGNVESDDVDVNLTAFETFFPEKRLFFVEGREIFDTTPRSDTKLNREPTSVINTRRIGGRPRAPTNVPAGTVVPSRERFQPTELTAAVKATGQLGHLRYGILAASEDDVKFDAGPLNLHQSGADYGVMRFLYETSFKGAYAALGTISTLVAHPDQDVLVHGIDGHFLSAGARWKVDGQLLYSDKDGIGQGAGGFVDAVYTHRRGLNFTMGFDHYDRKLDINDLGFLRRNDATNMRVGMNWTRANLGWARQWAVLPFAQYEINGDGDHTRRGFGTNNEIFLNNLARLDVYLAYFPERDEDRESFGNGTFVTKGRHDTNFDYTSDTSRRLSYKLGFDIDGEISGGDTWKARAGLVWRPLDRLSLELLGEYWQRGEWLLHQGGRDFTTFDTREVRPKLAFEYNFTARQQLRLSAQWIGIRAREQSFFRLRDGVERLAEGSKPPGPTDDFSVSNLNIQLRYRWEFAPLSDLFVVYTLGGVRSLADDGFDDLFNTSLEDPDIEQLVVKLRYRLGS